MCVQVLVSPEFHGNLLAVVDELGTTGPQRGTDTGPNPAGTAAEMLFHGLNGAADNILDTPSPTAMYVGNHPPGGLIQQHRLTIGNLNDKISAENIRHHAIRGNGPAGGGYASLFAITAQQCNIATMDLPGENKPACSHEAGDDTAVLGNIYMAITNTQADIQTCKGRGAIPAVAGKNPVIDPATGGQIFKLIRRYAVLSRQYHLVSPAGAIPGFYQ